MNGTARALVQEAHAQLARVMKADDAKFPEIYAVRDLRKIASDLRLAAEIILGEIVKR